MDRLPFASEVNHGYESVNTRTETDAQTQAEIKAQKVVSGWVQVLYDVLGAFASAFIALVVCMSFATSTFGLGKMQEYLGLGVKMGATGVVVCGAVLSLKSSIPYMVASPDLFLCPFLIAIATSLNDLLEPHEFVCTYVTLCVLTTLLMGVLLILSGDVKLLRFAEYLPYPVICGLLGSNACSMFKVAFGVASNKDWTQIVKFIPSLVVGASVTTCQLLKMNPAHFLPVILSVPMCIFYAVCYINGIGLEQAQEEGWLYRQNTLSHESLIVWTSGVFDLTHIKWGAMMYAGSRTLSEMLLLWLLRTSLTYSAASKTFQQRFDNNREIALLGVAFVASGAFGSFPTPLSLGTMAMVRDMKGGPNRPAWGMVGLMLFVCVSNFHFLAYVPKFLFASLLVSQGFMFIYTWVVKPFMCISTTEWCVIVFIMVWAQVQGMMTAIGVGLCISAVMFALRFNEIGCVKFVASGISYRSSVDRSDQERRWLTTHGEAIQIIQVQGYIAFANAGQIVDVVAEVLDNHRHEKEHIRIPLSHSHRSSGMYMELQRVWERLLGLLTFASRIGSRKSSLKRLKPGNDRWDDHQLGSESHTRSLAELFEEEWSTEETKKPKLRSNKASSSRESVPNPDPHPPLEGPKYLILDLSLVNAVDASAADALRMALYLCRGPGVAVCLCGVAKTLRTFFEANGILNDESVKLYSSTDECLSTCEDELLHTYLLHGQHPADTVPRRTPLEGYLHALEQIKITHSVEVRPLAALSSYVSQIHLKPGDDLMDYAYGSSLKNESCLYFIEYGYVGIRRDPTQTITPHTFVQGDDRHSFGHRLRAEFRAFRLHRLGPGWLAGLQELCTGHKSLGKMTADTHCIVHALRISDIEALSETDPELTLALYKLASLIMAKRFDHCKEQLAELTDCLYAHTHVDCLGDGQQYTQESV